jgi:hypothetical protein
MFMIQKFFSGLLLVLIVFASTYVGVHIIIALISWTNLLEVLSSADYIPGHVFGTLMSMAISLSILYHTGEEGAL